LKGLNDKINYLKNHPEIKLLKLSELDEKIIHNLENLFCNAVYIGKKESKEIDYIIRQLRIWVDREKGFNAFRILCLRIAVEKIHNFLLNKLYKVEYEISPKRSIRKSLKYERREYRKKLRKLKLKAKREKQWQSLIGIDKKNEKNGNSKHQTEKED